MKNPITHSISRTAAGVLFLLLMSNHGFVQITDTSFAYLWAKKIGSTSSDQGYSIAPDASGNVYVNYIIKY